MRRKLHWSRGLKTKFQICPCRCCSSREGIVGAQRIYCVLQGWAKCKSETPPTTTTTLTLKFSFVTLPFLGEWLIQGFSLWHQACPCYSSVSLPKGPWCVKSYTCLMGVGTPVLSHVGGCPAVFLSQKAPLCSQRLPHSCLWPGAF